MMVATPLATLPDASWHTLTAFATTFTLTSGAQRVAYVFQAPESGTINLAGFRTGTVTVGDTLKVSLQDVDLSSGNPDGGVDQYRTLVIADADDDAWKVTGLLTSDGTDGGAKRTVTRGQWLALVIEFDAFVAGNMQLGVVTGALLGGTCYCDRWTAAWTKSSNTPVMALQYADGAWRRPEGGLCCTAFGSTTLNTGTTPDELALRFKLNAPATLVGAHLRIDRDGDYDLVLYDDAGSTVVASMDKDVRVGTSEAGDRVLFATPVELLAGQVYRLAIKPTSATSVIVRSLTLPGSAYAAAEAGGAEFYLSTRADAGAWTDDQASKPMISLLLAGFEDRGPNRGLLTGGL